MLQVLPAYLDITRINMHLVSILFASYDKEIVTNTVVYIQLLMQLLKISNIHAVIKLPLQ